jgi:hypothetical protein
MDEFLGMLYRCQHDPKSKACDNCSFFCGHKLCFRISYLGREILFSNPAFTSLGI